MAELGKIGALVEKHPYITAGGVFVVGAIVIYLYYSGGSSSTTTTSGADPNYAAGLAAQVQLAQISAQSGAAEAQVSGAQSIAQTQANAQVTEAQLAAQTSQAGITAQTQVQTAGIQAQTTLAGISADVTKTQLYDQTQYLNAQLQSNAWQNWLVVFNNLASQWQSGAFAQASQANTGHA